MKVEIPKKILIQVNKDLWVSSILSLIISFPEESRTSTEVQPFQMSFEYLQEWKLHNFSGQSFPSLKNPCELLFSYVELEFPFLQLMSASLSFSLCVSEKGPALF